MSHEAEQDCLIAFKEGAYYGAETKTLNTIQKLAKLGKVLSQIVKICCIVGACFCLVGILSFSMGEVAVLRVGGVTLHSMIESNAQVSMGTLHAVMAAGMIICIGEAAIAGFAVRYFKNELAAGTPFTLDGAKEMMRLGICVIAISLGTVIAADAIYALANNAFADVADMELSGFNQIGTGIAFILASLLCRYGAEREEHSLHEV